jgi:hypothetical protein
VVDGKPYRGMRIIRVKPASYKHDKAYAKYIDDLLDFCEYSAASQEAYRERDEWPDINICTCHWPQDAFYGLANGTVGLRDGVLPLSWRELTANLTARESVVERSLSHHDPLTALAHTQDETAANLARAEAENAALRLDWVHACACVV